jgi:mycothiol synthase
VTSVDEIDARTAPEETLLALVAVEHACWHELAPGEPLRSADEAIAFFRFQPPTYVSHHWLADGCGTAGLYVHSPTATFLQLLVDPESRRRGIGSALLEVVRARCVELGVKTVYGHHSTGAGASFAARVGAVDGSRQVKSLLDLRSAALPEPAPPDGWRLATWLGRVPDGHIASFVRARAAMDDAPAPDDFELPAESVERVRAMEDSLRKRDREVRVTVALDDDDDEVGAFTDLRVSRGSMLGFTDDTGTVAAKRGRGLAKAVKLESLRRLRADHPEVTVVTTLNDEENAAMRHINESVGFRPSVVFTQAALTP